MANYDGTIYTVPALIEGTVDSDGETFGTGGGVIVHYALGAFDNLGNQYHWVNTEVSLASPPAPVPAGTYVASTLAVEGRF